MGMVQCEVHGLCFMSAVSPAVQRAVIDKERWSKGDLVSIRSEQTYDQEPRARFWLDRAMAGDRDEEVVPIGEALRLASGITCCECLAGWLLANGIDDGYSAAEERFLRIEEALEGVMRPRLEPSLQAICDVQLTRGGGSGFGFRSGRGWPFSAYAGSAAEPTAKVEVRDHDDHLVAAVVIVPVGATVPDPLRIDLVDGELDVEGLGDAALWADEVALALKPRSPATETRG